ncbi:hypothetical protein [Devosia sp. Leaf64]|uniref:hypothetical protein n=1 Tax=Devosia sp. Leaf64 TaxID=1736229 RepID=UPI00071381F6|nr:hypothetical protein [Devosia sp. Leaf64]KQN70058.1 hypothetical protein ASE94_13350 [Devosia sp. Leaf64]
MIGRIACVLVVLVAGATGAFAKDARCFTTDDGEYDCDFEATDDAGSFRISADGKPTFEVFIEDGQAYAGAVFAPGGRSVSLPGTYFRSEEDPACWVSDATETQICAW